MDYFLLFDQESQRTQIINYQPTVPDSVKVKKITFEEYQGLATNQTHYYDHVTDRIRPKLQSEVDKESKSRDQQKQNTENQLFLDSTDWKILRHLREQALNIATTLSQEQYLELERQRNQAAKNIII